MARPTTMGRAGTPRIWLRPRFPAAGMVRDRLLSDSAFLLGGFGVAAVTAQAYLMLMSRMLAAPDYGTLVTLASLSYVLAVLARTLQGWVIKAVAESGSAGNGDVRSVLEMAIRALLPIGGGIAAALWLGGGWVVDFLHLTSAAPLVMLGLYAFSALAITVPVGLLMGLGRMRMAGVVIALEAMFRLVVGTALVSVGLGASGAVIGYAVGSLAALAVGMVPLLPGMARRDGSSPVSPDFGGFGRFTLLGLLVNACLFGTGSIDQVAVKHYFPAEVAGDFAVAFLLGQIIVLATTSFAWVVFTRSAGMSPNDPGRARMLVDSLLAAGGLSAILTLGYLLAPNLAVLIMGGPGYGMAASYLGLEGVEMTLFALVFVQAYYQMAIRKTAVVWPLLLAGALQVVVTRQFHQTVQEYELGHILVLAGLLVCVSALSWWQLRVDRRALPDAVPASSETTLSPWGDS